MSNMEAMFYGATSFGGDIGDWNTLIVTSMRTMLFGANLFDLDDGNWGTSGVVNMDHMFVFATAFNQDISNRDMSEVSTFGSMFSGASTFDQNITWCLSSTVFASLVFENTQCKRPDCRVITGGACSIKNPTRANDARRRRVVSWWHWWGMIALALLSTLALSLITAALVVREKNTRVAFLPLPRERPL